MSQNRFDSIVVGLGCAGAAIVNSLSDKQNVLGIEQFDIVNEYGSSHGQSRLFRFAYHEGAEYVPLLQKSHDKWNDLEEEHNIPIFHPTGSITIGNESSGKVRRAKETCEKHGINYTLYQGDEFSEESDYWNLSEYFDFLYQPESGLIDSYNGIFALIENGKRQGASLKTQTTVIDWEKKDGIFHVLCADGTEYTSTNLILSKGPWASEIPELSDYLDIEKHIVAFCSSPEMPQLAFPTWVYDDGETQYYGSPSYKDKGVKVGDMTPTNLVDSVDSFSYDYSLDELRTAYEFFNDNFVQSCTSITGEVCPLTNTPDGNFVIDESEDVQNLYYCAGLSGHGLKLAPAIGEEMARLVLEDTTRPMFSLKRFE